MQIRLVTLNLTGTHVSALAHTRYLTPQQLMSAWAARFAAQAPHSPTPDGNRGKVHLRGWPGEKKMRRGANNFFFCILKEKKSLKICISCMHDIHRWK